ncbi:hypothetical protein BDF19DRAFT_40987 [Syncephalis fuscata]|nr:hypothetical protein BDF19DRAFT_40987 [Syncephalis fuscata]
MDSTLQIATDEAALMEQNVPEYTTLSGNNDIQNRPCSELPRPQCIASTQAVYSQTIGDTLHQEMDQIKYCGPLEKENNFFKTLHWAPDGSCLLTINNDNVVRLFNFPLEALNTDSDQLLSPALRVASGDIMYDACWYPRMSSQDPASCCFVTSTKDHPIQLWDAFTGHLRASYPIIDHQERFIGPTALTFNLDGSRIYAGYENMIEAFYIDRPGSQSVKYPTTPSRYSKKGQKGLISSLAFNPDRSGLYAASSFTGTIGLYTEQDQQLIYTLAGSDAGITQVKFTPDGNYLYSTSRKQNAILGWDVRQTGSILHRLEREHTTNQRLTFDIDPLGHRLVTGDQNGGITIFDIQTKTSSIEDSSSFSTHWAALHQDICSATEFHPIYHTSILASCSGQRKFPLDLEENDSDNDDVVPSTVNEENRIDNRLVIWQMAPISGFT